MSQLAAGNAFSPSPTASRVMTTCLAVVLGLVLLAALIDMTQGVPLPFISRSAPALTAELQATLNTQGAAAAEQEYRALKDKGFANYSESENETNNLGYELLGKKDPGAAVMFFRLNAEMHPLSANVFDSLGEGEAAVGDKQAAIVAYRHALELNVHQKSSEIALAKLTGVPRKPFKISTLLHISAGVLGILFGTLSMVANKGGRLHRLSGDGFFMAMLVMAGMGGTLAGLHHEPENVFGAIFTLYMLLTAWSAGRRRERKVNLLNYFALLAGAVVTVFGVSMGLKTFAEHGFVAPFIGLGLTAMLATGLDLRVIMIGGVTGAARIARHLWRMSAAFFVAVASFFLGQPQVMPEFLKRTNLVAVPVILVIAGMLYYLFRVLYWDRRGAHRASFKIEPLAHSGGVALGG